MSKRVPWLFFTIKIAPTFSIMQKLFDRCKIMFRTIYRQDWFHTCPILQKPVFPEDNHSTLSIKILIGIFTIKNDLLFIENTYMNHVYLAFSLFYYLPSNQ